MYHMLIVEDEPRQIKALVNVIRQLQPEIAVSEAYDGRMALEFIENHPVDVVITDIRMPNMDGMKLIEALHQAKNAPKIILLSGYGEFEYAQRAIKYGVFDYLVKPIGKADIEKLLRKLEQTLMQERNEKMEMQSLTKKLDDAFPVYLTHLLHKRMNGSISEAEANELEQIFMWKGPGMAAAAEIGKFDRFVAGHSDDEIENTMLAILDLIKEHTKSLGSSFSFGMEGTRNKFITIINLRQNSVRYIQEAAARLEVLIADVKMEFGLELTIGLSRGADDIFGEIKTSYEQAVVSLSKKFYHGLGKVIPYGEVKTTNEPFHLYNKEADIKNALRKSDSEAISRIINDYFDQTVSLFAMEPEQIKDELIHVMLNQLGLLKHLMTEQSYLQWVAEIRETLIKCEDYRELRHSSKSLFRKMIDLTRPREDKNALIIQECQRYIETHYAEDLSLDTLSSKYHFNASYFSNLFKTHAGIGLSEYVIKIRAQKAQELLLKTDDKMSEIALKVGYKDAPYFIRIFKREYGISPHKYRHLNGNG